MLRSETPSNFQLYHPDDTDPQQINIPYQNIKGYLEDLDEGFFVALVHWPTASGPCFPSVKAVPEQLLADYKIIVNSAPFQFFLLLMNNYRNYSGRNHPCYKFATHLGIPWWTSSNLMNGASWCSPF